MINKGKKIVIIGAISAGTSTAAKIRRKVRMQKSLYI